MTKFPTIYPSKNNPKYHLSDVFIQSIEGGNRGTGSDLSESSHVLYIGSAATERMIAFKGFIENMKVDFQKKVDEDKQALRSAVYFTENAKLL